MYNTAQLRAACSQRILPERWVALDLICRWHLPRVDDHLIEMSHLVVRHADGTTEPLRLGRHAARTRTKRDRYTGASEALRLLCPHTGRQKAAEQRSALLCPHTPCSPRGRATPPSALRHALQSYVFVERRPASAANRRQRTGCAGAQGSRAGRRRSTRMSSAHTRSPLLPAICTPASE